MNEAHLHLAISHFPVVGMIIGFLVYLFGLLKKNDEVIKVSFGLFILNLIFVVPTYFSGEAAEEFIERLPGFDETFIEKHELLSKFAVGGVILIGVLSALGLFFYRINKAIPKAMKSIFLIMVLGVSGLLVWTANRGGQIHHSEIRAVGFSDSSGSQIETPHEREK
jgi:uncharacterized membrane protein